MMYAKIMVQTSWSMTTVATVDAFSLCIGSVCYLKWQMGPSCIEQRHFTFKESIKHAVAGLSMQQILPLHLV